MKIKITDGTKKKKANPILLDYDFVDSTSHRIRTPIAIIKESVDLLLDEIPGSLNINQKKVLNICKSNVKRLVNEMDDILKYLYGKARAYEKIKKEKDINY